MVAQLEGLTRIGGTDAGGYFRLEENILVAVPRPGYVQQEADARRSLVELSRLVDELGRRQALVVIVDRVSSQDAGSRRVWQKELTPELLCCLCLVGGSLLARAIGSFFIGLRRPAVPTQMFPDLDSALVWAREKVEVAGGSIEAR